ncbi:MAG: RecX family transcriptional regulator [bacterium]|nr:RecX family transcriptional regulator [bacterium]
MKITKIGQQKHKSKRYSIFIDNEFIAGVDEQVLFGFCLREGKEITPEELKEIVQSEEKHKTKEKALMLLSYRARSKKELIEKLKQKEYEIKYINEVINELERLGLLNDLTYAKLWLESYRNAYGSFRLKAGLKAKGISEEIIKQAFDETGISELETAKHIAEKWRRLHSNLPEKEANQKLIGFLARRGISYDTIQSIIDL